jgi:hypothetical protein
MTTKLTDEETVTLVAYKLRGFSCESCWWATFDWMDQVLNCGHPKSPHNEVKPHFLCPYYQTHKLKEQP